MPYVLEKGFGEFAKRPKRIAERVSAWLNDDAKISEMRTNARAAATPQATRLIAMDLLRILDDPPKETI